MTYLLFTSNGVCEDELHHNLSSCSNIWCCAVVITIITVLQCWRGCQCYCQTIMVTDITTQLYMLYTSPAPHSMYLSVTITAGVNTSHSASQGPWWRAVHSHHPDNLLCWWQDFQSKVRRRIGGTAGTGQWTHQGDHKGVYWSSSESEAGRTHGWGACNSCC